MPDISRLYAIRDLVSSSKNKRLLVYISDKQATKISPFPGLVFVAFSLFVLFEQRHFHGLHCFNFTCGENVAVCVKRGFRCAMP